MAPHSTLWKMALLALAATALAPCGHAATEQYTLDPAHTSVSFEVRNFGISSQRGTFNGASGTVSLDAQAGSGQIEILIDARTLQTTNDRLAAFLRGKDLLNVERYPEIAYKAQRVVFLNGEPGRIEGELTLLGITKSVSLNVSGYRCTQATDVARQRCTMDAVATFKRSEFGMTRYMTVTSDEVKLAIQTEGVSD